ncbi:MAG: hypothetical protein SGILL_005294 [Bacillariaceae sp.]
MDQQSNHSNDGETGTTHAFKAKAKEEQKQVRLPTKRSCNKQQKTPRKRGARSSDAGPSSESILDIISVTYGPCESLSTDTAAGSNQEASNWVPFTRDCAPFLIKLLKSAQRKEAGDERPEVLDKWELSSEDQKPDGNQGGICMKTTVDGKSQAFVSLLGGGGRLSMNATFGDPCPGTSKRLTVHYTVTEIPSDKNASLSGSARTETHHAHFAEHEPVKLRRGLAVMNTAQDISRETNFRMTRIPQGLSASLDMKTSLTAGATAHEVLLPMVLPFLELGERIQCRIICRGWKKVVREWGVATTIDANDPRTTNTGHSIEFTRPALRGLLAHSYTSLQSLFLSGFQQLEKQDLHPALAQLQSLRTLDITRCTNMDDSTLHLIAKHLSGALQVLYLKGLKNVSDQGLQSICQSCSQLEVLDLSQVMDITDKSGTAIQRLKKLRALFLRDNFQLTNKSLDTITKQCIKLRQLTLWGIIRMEHLEFTELNAGRLLILNLWGCHSLGDDTARALESMQLKSLILSECHKLSDDFILAIAKIPGLKNIEHLHLRYLYRLSDKSLHAIAENFRALHSLDLSFCNNITASGIYELLHQQRGNLVELRLKSIRNIEIAYDDAATRNCSNNQRRFHQESSTSSSPQRKDRRNHVGHWILNALRPLVHSMVDHTLCVLDVRQCGGQPEAHVPYDAKDAFVVGMTKLRFAQAVPGFFTRSGAKS